MKAILADDEPTLLAHLKQTLMELWPELNIVATANNGKAAVDLINEHKPDIAFLDIRMPSLTGLEVAAKLPHYCEIVFVTAYDNYAIEAFETNAIDYLLKPFTHERLQKTIDRLKQKFALGQNLGKSTKDLFELLSKLQHSDVDNQSKLNWIRASLGEDTFLIHIDDVLYFESDTKYTNVVSREGSYPIRTPLVDLEQKLDSKSFRRIHRNAIVNLHAVERIKRLIDGRYTLFIKDHPKELTVSRSFAAQFKQM